MRPGAPYQEERPASRVSCRHAADGEADQVREAAASAPSTSCPQAPRQKGRPVEPRHQAAADDRARADSPSATQSASNPSAKGSSGMIARWQKETSDAPAARRGGQLDGNPELSRACRPARVRVRGDLRRRLPRGGRRMPRRRSLPTSSICIAAALCVSSCRSLSHLGLDQLVLRGTDTNSPAAIENRRPRAREPGEQDRVLRAAAAATPAISETL